MLHIKHLLVINHMEVTGSNMKNTAVLTEDEYREFNDRVAILSQKGYDLVHEVHYQEDKTFKIKIHGEHDFDELDKICNEEL